MRDVAAEAGVAESTVYPVYGNKPGLALALVDAIDADAGLDDTSAEISRAAGDPAGQLAAMVGFDRRLFERGGDVVGLLSDAGRSEPDLAAPTNRAERVPTRYANASSPRGRRRRSGKAWTPQSAADTCAALCNIGVYRVLTDERGWSPDHIERWWHDSLIHLMIADQPPHRRIHRDLGRPRDRFQARS